MMASIPVRRAMMAVHGANVVRHAHRDLGSPYGHCLGHVILDSCFRVNVAADAELTRSVEKLNMRKDRAATFSLQRRATFSICAVCLLSYSLRPC